MLRGRMTSDGNPADAAATFAADGTGAGSKHRYRVTLLPDRVTLELCDGDPDEEAGPRDRIDVPREDFAARVSIHHGALARRTLFVDGWLALKLDPAGFTLLLDWVGPPSEADLRAALRRRLGWIVPIATILVMLSVRNLLLPQGGASSAFASEPLLLGSG